MKKSVYVFEKNTIAYPNNYDLYHKYLTDIYQYPVLSRIEEIELFRQLKSGDESVIDTIVESNLRFVISCAKKYQSVIKTTNITLEDLISEGNFGLYKAIKSYDYTLDIKFISYAVFEIKNVILQYINANIRSIKIPAHRYAILTKLHKIESKIEQELQRNVDDSELIKVANEIGDFKNVLQDNVILTLKTDLYYDKSLDTQITNESDFTLLDIIENKNSDNADVDLLKSEQEKYINLIIDTIPSERNRNIIIDYFGLNEQEVLNHHDIAKKYGISNDRTYSIIKSSIRLLKIKFNKKCLSYQ